MRVSEFAVGLFVGGVWVVLSVIGANYFPMSTVIFTKMQDYLVGDIPTSHQLVEEWECDLHNIVHPTRWHARCNPIPPVRTPRHLPAFPPQPHTRLEPPGAWSIILSPARFAGL